MLSTDFFTSLRNDDIDIKARAKPEHVKMHPGRH